MAISPIAIATQGLLNSPLSVAAVRGHLIIEADDAIGSGLMLPGNRIWQRLWREDDEILAIIAAFMNVMDDDE